MKLPTKIEKLWGILLSPVFTPLMKFQDFGTLVQG